MHVAIIGAGMAGLSAARRLHEIQPAITITIYEKSRGVGGRAATRRKHGAIFDHGAQYIKGGTPAIDQLLHSLPHETLIDIKQPVWTFDRHGAISEGDREQNREPKWSYTDGITRLAKELARYLDVRFGTRIQKFVQANGSYLLFDDQDNVVGAADALLLTAPAPQSHALIAASTFAADGQAALLHELAQAQYRPCLTFTFGYPAITTARPFYALVNTDKQHPISWLAYEHVKPGRAMSGQHVLIAQLAPAWSNDHWNDDPEEAAQAAAQLVADLLHENLAAPQWFDRQGWRYALPDSGADFETLNQAVPDVFFAGDFTAGQGRVHRAIEQGRQVANLIVQQLSD